MTSLGWATVTSLFSLTRAATCAASRRRSESCADCRLGFVAGRFHASTSPSLLTGGDEEVADLKAAPRVGWQRRPPGRFVAEIGLRVMADDADDDLGDDAAPDVAKVVAPAADRGLAQDIQPEGRFVLPVAETELGPRQRGCADGAGDRFAGRQAGAHAALQVPGGQGSVGADFDDAGN